MAKEEWKIIEGYDGYMVSNLGRVMTIKTGYMHEYDIDVWGYYRVCLSKNGVKKHPKVSILVAKAFIPNPYNLPQVDHIDEDKSNNCVWNLRWVSAKTNCNHGTRNQRISESKYVPVEKVTLEGKVVGEYASMKEASEMNNVKRNSVSNNCRGASRTVMVDGVKYIFRYKGER